VTRSVQAASDKLAAGGRGCKGGIPQSEFQSNVENAPMARRCVSSKDVGKDSSPLVDVSKDQKRSTLSLETVSSTTSASPSVDITEEGVIDAVHLPVADNSSSPALSVTERRRTREKPSVKKRGAKRRALVDIKANTETMEMRAVRKFDHEIEVEKVYAPPSSGGMLSASHLRPCGGSSPNMPVTEEEPISKISSIEKREAKCLDLVDVEIDTETVNSRVATTVRCEIDPKEVSSPSPDGGMGCASHVGL
ncbi:unnamed protein product, partial [Choristocarpus tenellus]